MAGLFGNLFAKKSTSVIGIDIGSSAIKVVELYKKGGKAVLKTYGEIALGPYAGQGAGQAVKITLDKATEALNDVLKEASVTSRDAGVSVPMKSSMVSIMNFPAVVDAKRLKEMVPIEARKYIPVPITEVALDWSVIPSVDEEEETARRKKGITEVLLVAIHNTVLNNLSTIIKQASVQANFYEIEMFSVIRALLDSNDIQPVFILDMGAGATKIYITERGVIRESHNISHGSQDITLRISQAMGVSLEYAEQLKRSYGKNTKEQDQKVKEIAELALEPIFSEGQQVLLNFQKKYGRVVSKVILTGGGVALTGMAEYARKYFETEVEIGNPFTKVQAPAFLSDVLQSAGLEFAPAVGLALRKLQEID